MPQIRIQGFGSRSCQEDSPQQDHSLGINGKKLNGIVGIHRSHHTGSVDQLAHAKYTQKDEPKEHHRAKHPADQTRAKLLEEEEKQEDREYDGNHRNVFIEDIQTFHCRGHRDGRCDDAVCKQGTTPYHRDDGNQVRLSPYQGKKGKDPSLTVVIGLKSDDDVFESSLEGKGPEDTG